MTLIDRRRRQSRPHGALRTGQCPQQRPLQLVSKTRRAAEARCQFGDGQPPELDLGGNLRQDGL